MLSWVYASWHRFWTYSPWRIPAVAAARAALVVLGAMLVYRAARAGIKRFFASARVRGRYLDQRRADTLSSSLVSILRYTVYFLAAGLILPLLGINVGALAAAAGIGGVAVAFGAQHLIRDVITGFFLLFEDQLAVGDQVIAAGVTGTVEEAGFRVTRIRDAEGRLHIIPNGQIAQVTNLSTNARTGYVDVPVGARSDLLLLEEVTGRVCREFAAEHGPALAGLRVAGLVQLPAGLGLRVVFTAAAAERDRLEPLLRRALYLAVTGAGLPWRSR